MNFSNQNSTLWVGDLDSNWTEYELLSYFSHCSININNIFY